MTVAKAPKAKTRAPAPAAVREVMIAGRPRDRYDEILALQRAAGNRAVSQLLQAKVGIGGPGNRYEREADRAACQESPAGSLPAGIEAVVRGGGGQPLDPDTRDYMESRFGADFGYVRVHNDAQARASAASLGARAFTYGNHVAFGTNGFAPHDASGRHLLAHELAHVVQQSADRTGSFLPASDTSSEREADAAAHSAIAGRSAQVHMRTGIRIARQPQSPLSIPGEGVDMPWVGKGAGVSSSDLGYLRDSQFFWQEFQNRYPQLISPQNAQLIANHASPVVDATWVLHHPEHTAYMGEILEHHHVGQGSRAVPLPESLHDAYTVFHPQRRVVGTPSGGIRPLPSQPTRAQYQAEINRHVQQGQHPRTRYRAANIAAGP